MPTNDVKPFSKLIKNKESLYLINSIPFVLRNPLSNHNSHVEVCVSELKKDLSLPLTTKAAFASSSQRKPPNIESVNLTVGDLSGIRAGSVWSNGKIVDIDQKEELFEVDINESTINYLTSLRDNKGYSLIPRQYWPLGRAISSNFVAVNHNNDPYGLLIPSIELIQFYFGSSSKFNKAVLNGGIHELDKIISIKDSGINKETGDVHVTLRKDYPDVDAWIIARILSSDIARKAALKPYNSLQKHFIKNPYHYYGSPEAMFPFQGETKLRAIVKPYKINNIWRYFVLEIISCTHPLSFNNVHVYRQNDGREGTENSEEKHIDKPIAFLDSQKLKNDNKDRHINSTQDPTNKIEPITMNISKKRFPALFGKKLIKAKKQFTEYRTGLPNDEVVKEIIEFSTGEAYSGNSNASSISIDIENNEPRRRFTLPATFNQLHMLIDRISDKFSIYPSLYESADEYSKDIPLFFFPEYTKEHKLIYWSKLPKGSNRCALLCCLKVNHKFVYLLEIQRNPNKPAESFSTLIFTKTKYWEELSYLELQIILYELAIRTRTKLSYEDIFKNYNFCKLVHGFVSIENHLDAAINKILFV